MLLHLASLPGPLGTGDLGPAAYAFADWLKQAGQSWWQMLPITPLGCPPGYSPYSSDSAFAGNPYLIDLTRLAETSYEPSNHANPRANSTAPSGSSRVLPRSPETARAPLPLQRPLPEGRAHYAASIAFRERALRLAYDGFSARPARTRHAFESFCHSQHHWLPDYALYSALKRLHGNSPWITWDPDLRARRPAALAAARARLHAEIDYHQWLQYVFHTQWHALRTYCNTLGIGLIGDVPIFVAHDSADVWANQHLFVLDSQGHPKVVTGVPPDIFSAEGQRWGHPQYDWPAHRKHRYAWWLARLASMFDHFDAVRIDHFIGFHRSWWISANSPTAKNGRWTPGPGADFFDAVHRRFGTDAQIIAEDLGELTDGAIQLRDRFGLPGMRIMQFGFAGDADYYLPHAYPQNSVAYTGTHDNDTTVGWYRALERHAQHDKNARTSLETLHTYTGARTARDVAPAMIRALYLSQSRTAITPAQDLLSLPGRARMNTPGVCDGNWRWRLRPGEMSSQLAENVRQMADAFGRAPAVR